MASPSSSASCSTVRPLDKLLGGQPMPAERLLDLGVQLMDALAAVHARGLIHGNIKPSNVFITTGGESGNVKLLELGVMSAWWEADRPAADRRFVADDVRRPSRAGRATTSKRFTRIGRPSRSPERRSITGRTSSRRARSCTRWPPGKAAFPGGTRSEIAAAIVGSEPVPVRQHNPLAPRAIETIIERALTKPAAGRYPTAAEMGADLRRARRRLESSSAVTVAQPVRPKRRLLVPGIGPAGSSIGGARGLEVDGFWRCPRSVTRSSSAASRTAPTTRTSMARFNRRSIVHLGQSPFLDIVSDERLREILRMMSRPDDAPLTHDVAREACQRLGLNAMLEGSVSAVGASTVVALVATDCATGETIAREQVGGEPQGRSSSRGRPHGVVDARVAR